jgi:kynurenine 3-monooxygenase
LMSLAEKNPKIKIKFQQRCTNIDFKTGDVSFQHEVTKERYKVRGELIFGCDGAFSAAREQMVKTPRFNYSQTYIEHGYKELHIPDLDGKWQLDKNSLHIWPRGAYMMIGLPNMDGSFTMTCFFPWEGENGFEVLDNCSNERVLEFFNKDFKDAVALMPNLLEDWRKNPTSGLVTVRTYPWSVNGKCALIGTIFFLCYL